MILLALTSLNLPQPWPDLSNTVVCLYFNSVLIGKYVTGNASRARAEFGLVWNTRLDIKTVLVNFRLRRSLAKGISLEVDKCVPFMWQVSFRYLKLGWS